MATFSVDGPGQGEAEYDLAIRGDWEVPGAAISTGSGRVGLDAGRIGVWGVSLGGYYAPAWPAATTGRVRRAGRAVQLRRLLGQPPGLTREAFRVRSNRRTWLRPGGGGRAQPGGRAELIRCPLLAVMGKLDRLIPWQDGERLVNEAGGRPSCCCWRTATTAARTWRPFTATARPTGWPSS